MKTVAITNRQTPRDDENSAPPVESDSLVEEVSIDGMCGVY
ncbi:mycofactocin precursor MftA [Microbacterium sp. Marseille-Q6965]|nr:mycofactocin precursor MftA [Microbacterium sp. Marseille-Q6965]